MFNSYCDVDLDYKIYLDEICYVDAHHRGEIYFSDDHPCGDVYHLDKLPDDPFYSIDGGHLLEIVYLPEIYLIDIDLHLGYLRASLNYLNILFSSPLAEMYACCCCHCCNHYFFFYCCQSSDLMRLMNLDAFPLNKLE